MERKKIFIIDDEEDLLEMYKDLIEAEGYDVETCSSGQMAVKKLQNQTYNLIVSDYNIDSVSGCDLLEIANVKHEDTPFFLITGEVVENLFFKNALCKVIPKPLDINLLIKYIKAVV